MPHLKKEIRVELLKEAEDYFLGLNEKIQAKFLRSFDKTESGLKRVVVCETKIERKHF
jgi:hypothetical protein